MPLCNKFFILLQTCASFVLSRLPSLCLQQFTPPRLGPGSAWNEPTFACRTSHVIRPSVDQFPWSGDTLTSDIPSGETLLRVDLSQNVAAAIFSSASRTNHALHSTSLFDYKVRTMKAVPPCNIPFTGPSCLGSADVEKRCLLSLYQCCQYSTEQCVRSWRECSKMLQQRTRVNLALRRGRSVTLS